MEDQPVLQQPSRQVGHKTIPYGSHEYIICILVLSKTKQFVWSELLISSVVTKQKPNMVLLLCVVVWRKLMLCVVLCFRVGQKLWRKLDLVGAHGGYARAARPMVGLEPAWDLTRACRASIQLPYKSGFRHDFSKKLSRGPKKGLETCVSRFSTICAKNHVLKFKKK